jgi:hypothetical protein
MVTLSIENSYGELDQITWLLRFRAAQGAFYRTLFTWMNPGGTQNLKYSFLPGTYWVETGNTGGEVNLATYNITLQTSSPCPDDEYEDNDFMWEAKDLSEGTYSLYACDDDTDYFRVAVEAGKTLSARISQVPAGNLERRLRITDSGNVLLRQSTGPGDPMTVTWTAAETSDYHIVILWWDDTAYQLEVEILD